jgi:GntR family transcriptional regulator
MERFAASRDTVRDATKVLIQEGLVKRVPGRLGGMVVRRHKSLTFHAALAGDPDGYDEADSWITDVRAHGLVPSQDFECRMVVLPRDLAFRLGEPEGAPAVLRRRLRRVDGRPSSIQDSYYPRWLADEIPELLSPTDLGQDAGRALTERGHAQVGYTDHISARMPTHLEAELLDLGPGTPVLVKTQTAGTPTRAVRVTVETMAGDSTILQYEIGEVSAARKPNSTS